MACGSICPSASPPELNLDMWKWSELESCFQVISFHKDRLEELVQAHPGGLQSHPHRRLIWPWLRGDDGDDKIEVRLKPELWSWDKLFLEGGKSWIDLCLLLRRYFDVLWLSEGTFLTTGTPSVCELLNFKVHGDIGVKTKASCPDSSPLRHSVNICSVSNLTPSHDDLQQLFRLIAQTPAVCEVTMTPGFSYMGSRNDAQPLSWSPATLECFFRAIGHAKLVSYTIQFSRDQCRSFSSFHGPAHFHCCVFEEEGAPFFEAVAHSQGPRELKLENTTVDMDILGNCLEQTSSLRSLDLEDMGDFLDPYIVQFCQAVKSNNSLTMLRIGGEDIILDHWDWDKACEYLLQNQSLKEVVFQVDIRALDDGGNDLDIGEYSRSKMIAERLRVNTVLQRLDIYEILVDDGILNGEIRSLLDRNRILSRISELLERATTYAERDLLFRYFISLEQVRRSPLLLWTLMSSCHEVMSSPIPVAEDERAPKRQRLDRSTDGSDEEREVS